MSRTPNKTPNLIPIKNDQGDHVSSPSSHSEVDIKYLLRALVKYGASDLHLKVGRPPMFRINGKLVTAKMPELGNEEVERIIFGILSSKQAAELDDKRQIDFSFKVSNLGRFRCSVFYQR